MALQPALLQPSACWRRDSLSLSLSLSHTHTHTLSFCAQFAPLTGIEVLSTRVEGSVLVAEVRLSVNLTNRSIDEVLSKLQRSHLQLLDLALDDLRFANAPSAALWRLEVARAEAVSKDRLWCVARAFEAAGLRAAGSCLQHACNRRARACSTLIC